MIPLYVLSEFSLNMFNLLLVLYGCETWSLTLREKHRLRVSENRVLRGIFGSKRDEVTRERRKLHNKELSDLYSSPYIKSRKMRWVEHVACMGVRRGEYRVLVGKPEGKSHLGDLGVDERKILRSSESGMWGYGLDRTGSG
jgi:hypothetical protein